MSDKFLKDWETPGALEDIFLDHLEERVAFLEQKTNKTFPNDHLALESLERNAESFVPLVRQITDGMAEVVRDPAPDKIEALAKAAFLAGMMTESFGELAFYYRLWNRRKSQSEGGQIDKQNPAIAAVIRAAMAEIENPTPAKVMRKLRVKYKNSDEPRVEDREDGTTYICCSGGELAFGSIYRYMKKIREQKKVQH